MTGNLDKNAPGFLYQLSPHPMDSDFRDDATRKSRDYLSKQMETDYLKVDKSWCMPVDKRSAHTKLLIHAWLTFGFLMGPATGLIAGGIYYFADQMGLSSENTTVLKAFAGLGVAIGILHVVLAVLEPSRLKRVVCNRSDALANQLPGLDHQWIHVNNGHWYNPAALEGIVPWDQACLFLDSDNKRLVIDGYFYRYLLTADDIISIEPVTPTPSVVARVICQIQGVEMNFVLVLHNSASVEGSAGQHPLLSGYSALKWADDMRAAIGWELEQQDEGGCPVCYREPGENAIEFGGHRVCPGCKETFVQQLKEGVDMN